ncbi:MAG: hypothetical protein HYU64_19725 [Armatimonadetes bacterium]|nr:hypothetical protein [Armatimonadota bacterium]
MLFGNNEGFSQRRFNAPFLLAILALLIFTVCGKVPAVASSTTLLTASGHTYKILTVNPLIFRTGKKCIVVKYVTNKKLGDTSGLREEAVELAREYVRGNPSFLKEFQEGILVQSVEKESSPMDINKVYNTPIGSVQVRKLLGELKIRSQKLCVTASGWSRSLQGPLEAISNARRGETYYFLIILDGVKRDKEGREQLLITANFKAPVGKPQTLSQPLSISRHAGVPVAHIFSKFDPGDPSGTYHVENIRVKDLNSGQEVLVNSASIFLK